MAHLLELNPLTIFRCATSKHALSYKHGFNHMRLSKKQNPRSSDQHQHHHHHHPLQYINAEIHKAAAQAWLSHTSSDAGLRPAGSEFDVHRINFQPQPSRFKIEAIKKAAMEAAEAAAMTSLDFNRSLLDTYEIVAVSKRLERGLVLDHDFSRLFDDDFDHDGKRRKRESSHSLRKLFNKTSSRKFDEPQDHSRQS